MNKAVTVASLLPLLVAVFPFELRVVRSGGTAGAVGGSTSSTPHPRLVVAQRAFTGRPPRAGDTVLFCDPYASAPRRFCVGTVALAAGTGGLGDGQCEVDVQEGELSAGLVLPAQLVVGRAVLQVALPALFA